jgi:ABC-type uncharacterized transport system substrate-binding protein
MNKIKKGLIISALLLIVSIKGYAHPHTFIDAEIECEFTASGLKGFWINWTFDPMFTSSIIMDYDLDRNGVFSEEEILDIEENAFSNLINYNYFIYITENRKTFRPEEVSDFYASIKGEDILYRFFVPYESVSAEKGNNVIIAIYDDSFFCDVAVNNTEKIQNSFSDNYKIDMQIRKNEDKTIQYDNAFQSITRDGAVYSGIVNPQELVLRFSEK